MRNVCCVKCGKEYSYRGIFTHYDRTHLKNKKYSSGNNGKYKEISQRIINEYYKNPKLCKKCKSIISHQKKNNDFCSNSCSASHNNAGRKHSEKTKRKMSLNSGNTFCSIHYVNCKNCNNIFCTKKKDKKYCSKKCRKSFNKRKLSKKQRYRRECQFQFSIKDHKNKFDTHLIEKYGWYKAPNRGNNPKGVSRDHMVSISYGWDHDIPAEIISHPANCKLMCNYENWYKRGNCSITIEELYDRINNW